MRIRNCKEQRMTPRTREDSREPGIHRRTWKAHKDHRTRELQAQLRALERSSQNSLSQSQHPRGHSRFSSSSLGKSRMGEAFPWREERLLCLWILTLGSMRSGQGDSLAAPSLQKHQTHPPQGNPYSIPRIPTEFCKTTSEHQNYRRKDLSLVSICPRNPRVSKIEGKAPPSRKAPNSGREENPSLPISIKYKNTVSMGISHCWER